jgi:predicted ferric reductase
MIVLTLIGGYAWLYNLVLYKRVAPKAEGQNVRYTQRHDVNELIIVLQRPFHAQPGQFVFISITQSARNLPAELHPFSLSGIIGSAVAVVIFAIFVSARRRKSLK